MLRTITICFAALLAAVPTVAGPSREDAHVRAVHPDLAKLFEAGVARSSTLRELVEKLQHTDVAVLMEFDNLPGDLAGGLRFITRAGHLRLLRVSIRRTLARAQIVKTIAHELQHALEVARAPQIVNEATLIAFYRGIDHDGRAFERFDTDEAQRTGETVAADLRAKHTQTPILGPEGAGRIGPGVRR